MRPILTLLLLFSIAVCEAQSYQLFRSDRTGYYRMGNHISAASLHVIETSIVDGDSVFVFEPQMIRAEHPNDWDCYASDASWLGREIRISPEGDTRIITATDEEILIITQANVGESWIAWTASDSSMFLEASVTSLAVEEVMGESDIVLSIHFEMQYDDELNGTSEFEESVVKIGAEFGLIESPLWALFPHNATPTTMMYASTAKLEGIEGEAGWQDFSWMDVMDFEPGDEIHIDEGINLGSGGSWTKSAITFVSREDYPDSIVYEVERVWWSFSDLVPPGEDPTSNEGISLGSMVVHPDTLFDTRPYVPVFFGDGFNAGYLLMGHNGDRQFKTHGIGSTISPYLEIDQENDCFSPAMHSGCGGLCYPGLGGPYYDCDFPSGPGGEWRKLVYYKKADEEWGTSLTLSTSEHSSNQISLLQTYPNPSTGSFRIALDAAEYPANVEVFDLRGRRLQQQNLSSEGVEIQLSSISPQLLILKVSTAAGNSFSGRVLIVE
ncbi:MAG: T9SS type A sorting domain-containing protein [Cryomorphaceae bacterium]|nr:T9SS type A sorting domain-containing protein [Flavobacteriales bacterium]